MKTLIVYYSFTSNNELLARELQERLNADLFRIETRKKKTPLSIIWDIFLNRTPEIKDFYHARQFYDRYILIAPVWAGRIASPMKSFLTQQKQLITDYSFITLCGGGAPGQRQKIAGSLARLVGHRPTVIAELWLKDLISESSDPRSHPTTVKLQHSDLKFFKKKLDEFIRMLDAEILVES